MPETTYEANLERLIALLQEHEIFTEFAPEEITTFASRAEISFHEQGEKIIRQGEGQVDRFYVVISGQLRVIDISHDPPQLLSYLPPGAIFGTRALMEDQPRAATVEVIVDGWLAVFTRADWVWLTHQNDRIIDYFRNLEREFDRPQQDDFPGKQWDEVVVISVKRHILAYLAKLPLPLALLITPLLFLIAGELLGINFLSSSTNDLVLTLAIILPFVLLSVVLAIFHYLDWRNDDFIVTTKRVIHIERILLYGQQRDEAPLTRIQDVTVVSFDLLEKFFDYHDLEISTAGAGVISFDGIPDATRIRELIFLERQQALARVGAAAVGTVRELIAKRLDWEHALEKPIVAVAEEEAVVTTQVKTRHLPGFLDYLWPRVKEVNEDENGETIIIWRKHLFILLATIFFPSLALLISLYLLLASLFGLPPFEDPTGTLALVVFGLITLVSLGWYLLRYDDWSRDRYIVTNTRIVDVEATPFRLRGEQRREGTFDNIQNITYDIPNFFSQLLNIGDVEIETAGVERTFTFEKVFKPSAVQEEIFNRMVHFQQRQRERAREANADQLVEVIKEYHHLNEKARQLPRPPS